MKKQIVAAAFFALLPAQAIAHEPLRKFRWSPAAGAAPHALFGAAIVGEPEERALPGVDETVRRESQRLGPAFVEGTWRQTLRDRAGELTYAAGSWAEGLPSPTQLREMEASLLAVRDRALRDQPELREATRVYPPRLEVRKTPGGAWTPYWRVEYLAASGDEIRYLLVDREGKVFARGSLRWDGVDGRAMVFPRGPRLSEAQVAPLRDLSGDGTVSGRLLRVVSALDLRVWSPDLNFFFSAGDRRFDLGQAYFTIERGLRWMKEHVGAEIPAPVEVRLHVGDGGVSNAAFYHQNTIYLGAGDGTLYRDLIRDPSVVIHEGMHAVIDAYAGLPSEGEGGGLNEGFADLFTALILDNPRMAEASYVKGPYRRTLENQLQAYRDFGAGVYQSGSVVGATLWDLRERLGAELTAKLAFRTLVRLGHGAGFDDFGPALAAAAEGWLSPEQKELALGAARARGWKVP